MKCGVYFSGFHRRLYWKSDLQSMVSFHLGNFSSDNYIKNKYKFWQSYSRHVRKTQISYVTKRMANTHSALQVQNILTFPGKKREKKKKSTVIFIYDPDHTYLCGYIKEDISLNPTQTAI